MRTRVVERDGQHVAGLDGVAGRLLAHAVDADMAGLDQGSGAAAGLHHPRMPQPFIETLALQATPLRSHPVLRLAERECRKASSSLRPAASCSLSAASFANGEFGSTGRSRSRGAALVAHCRCDGPLSRPPLPPKPPLSRPPLSRPPCRDLPPTCPAACPYPEVCLAACRCPCPCLENARAAAGRRGPRAAGLPARHRRRRRASRLQPAAHRCGACGNRGCGRAVRGDAARLWQRRRLHRRRRPRRPRLARDGRDGADGCDRDAAGALPSGHRAARPRPFQARRRLRARLLGNARIRRCISSGNGLRRGFSSGLLLRRFHGGSFDRSRRLRLSFGSCSLDGAASTARRSTASTMARVPAAPLRPQPARRLVGRGENAISGSKRRRASGVARLPLADAAAAAASLAIGRRLRCVSVTASEVASDAASAAAGASTTTGFGGSGAFFSMR